MTTQNDTLFREIVKLKRKLRHGTAPVSENAARSPKREKILRLLLSADSGLRQKELCETMGVGAPAMSETIDRLETDNYIERIPDPKDRRATRIILTAKGKARAFEIQDTHNELVNDLFKNLDESEKEQLIFLIRKITE